MILVAVKLNKGEKPVIFRFPFEKNAREFINDIEKGWPDIEWAISSEVKE